MERGGERLGLGRGMLLKSLTPGLLPPSSGSAQRLTMSQVKITRLVKEGRVPQVTELPSSGVLSEEHPSCHKGTLAFWFQRQRPPGAAWPITAEEQRLA